MALMMMTSLVLAAVQPLPSEPRAAAPATESEKMICKHQALTGTRFAKKICYTKADWDAKAEADRRALAEMTGNTVQRESKRD